MFPNSYNTYLNRPGSENVFVFFGNDNNGFRYTYYGDHYNAFFVTMYFLFVCNNSFIFTLYFVYHDIMNITKSLNIENTKTYYGKFIYEE